MQVLLVDTSEGAQIGTKCRSGPFTGIAVDLASAIPIIIPGPLAGAVAHGGVGGMAAVIALPFVGIELRAGGRNVVGNQVVAGPCVRVITHPEALLTCLPRYHTENGRAIVGISAVPFALVAAPTWRVGGIQMRGAFFPPRSGRVHPPRRWPRSSCRPEPCHSDSSARAGAAYAVAYATFPVHGRGAPSVRLWQCRGAGAPGLQDAAASSRTPCRSAACNSRHRPGSGRRESDLVRGTAVVRSAHSGGMSAHLGGGGVPARGCRCCRPGVQRSESLSCSYDTTSSTVTTHEPRFHTRYVSEWCAVPRRSGEAWERRLVPLAEEDHPDDLEPRGVQREEQTRNCHWQRGSRRASAVWISL